MFWLSQPGAAGDVHGDGKISIGVQCYLRPQLSAIRLFTGQPIWTWKLEPPETSNAALSGPQNPYPTFSPDVPGKYRIAFTVDGKTSTLTMEAS